MNKKIVKEDIKLNSSLNSLVDLSRVRNIHKKYFETFWNENFSMRLNAYEYDTEEVKLIQKFVYGRILQLIYNTVFDELKSLTYQLIFRKGKEGWSYGYSLEEMEKLKIPKNWTEDDLGVFMTQFNEIAIKRIVSHNYTVPIFISKVQSDLFNYTDKKIQLTEKEKEEYSSENTSLNRLLNVSQDKIKQLRKSKQDNAPTIKREIIDKFTISLEQKVNDLVPKCRFKNGQINYSKLGRMLNVSNHTAKRFCNDYRIPKVLPQ